jgi:hypothetical protein
LLCGERKIRRMGKPLAAVPQQIHPLLKSFWEVISARDEGEREGRGEGEGGKGER